MSIFLAILALVVLIIIHELGHFIAAKACGVKVNEFSLFFGPKILSWQGKETKYSIGCLPLGGYCAMEGEEEASENDRAFNKAPRWKRAIIIAAGPLINILFALVVMSIIMCTTQFVTNKIDYIKPGSSADTVGIQSGDELYKINGKRVYMASDIDILTYGQTPETIDLTILRDGEKINYTVTPDYTRYMMNITIGAASGPESLDVKSVVEGGAADKAGILAGDRLYAVNGHELGEQYTLDQALSDSKGQEITVTVTRNGENKDLKLTPEAAIQNVGTAMGLYNFVYEERTLLNSIPSSIDYLISSTRSIYLSFIWLLNGTVSVTEVSGPVGIVATMSEVVDSVETFKDKMINLFIIASLISINLGIANLLPIPALDGCKLLFIGYSAITRKEIPVKVEGIISTIGFVILIILMVLVVAKDIWGLIF